MSFFLETRDPRGAVLLLFSLAEALGADFAAGPEKNRAYI
jgi:hypothetical protein